MQHCNITVVFGSILAISVYFLATDSNAGEKLLVEPKKTVLLKLKRSASIVTVKNPNIADVNVLSPRRILVLGKSAGVTKIHISTKDGRTIRVYDVTVTPWVDNKVTINLGADAIKTLKCQPRCIQTNNPGKAPTGSKSGGGNAGTVSQQPIGRGIPQATSAIK